MRLLVRLIAALLGLAFAAAGVLLVIEVVWSLMRPDTSGLVVPWASTRGMLSGLSWDETPIRVAAGIAVAAGLILLFVAITAGRRDIRLHDPAPDVTVTTDRRSLARLVGHQVRNQSGVAAATVTATTNRVQVKATGKFSSVGDLRDRLSETAEHAVDDLPLQRKPTMSVSVSSTKERR